MTLQLNNMLPDQAYALVFPGQGAHHSLMLAAFEQHPHFLSRWRLICEAIHRDPQRPLTDVTDADLNQNLMSSLMTLLASSIALDRFRDQVSSMPRAVGGYSVGQWTALYAAGAIDFPTLVRLVTARARAMDQCSRQEVGGMLAVIGLTHDLLEAYCLERRAAGDPIWVSNINAPGQCSLAGSLEAITKAFEDLGQLEPKKLIKLPVSGAWHCPMMANAAETFAPILDDQALDPTPIPIVDNVTGTWLPNEEFERKSRLLRHLYQPVAWSACVKRLVDHGCQFLIEVGFGNTLSKYGFFIHRGARHLTFPG